MTGRGAWTAVGHGCGTRYYSYVSGRGIDGSTPEKSLDHKAVNSAVRAIQTELNLKFNQTLKIDGQFGPATRDGVKAAQTQLSLSADGSVGPNTARELFRGRLVSAATTATIDPALLYGQTMHESTFDPGARGYFNEADSGLVQINLDVFTTITWEQAFNPAFSLDYSAKRMKKALDKYASKPDLQVPCAIASHNSPASADTWFKNGVPPNKSIEDYVVAVLRYAQDYEFPIA